MSSQGPVEDAQGPSVQLRSWSEIDLIALDVILENTFHYTTLLDPSLSCGPISLWAKALRHKVAMTSLCKHWRLAALPHLYHTIVLRRVGQVFAFADTVRSTEYACFVRSITFICHVPDAVRSAYRRVVLDILDRCNNIAHLTFGPTCVAVRAVQDLTKTPFDNVLAASILHVLPKLATFRILDSAFTCDP